MLFEYCNNELLFTHACISIDIQLDATDEEFDLERVLLGLLFDEPAGRDDWPSVQQSNVVGDKHDTDRLSCTDHAVIGSDIRLACTRAHSVSTGSHPGKMRDATVVVRFCLKPEISVIKLKFCGVNFILIINRWFLFVVYGYNIIYVNLRFFFF